MSSIGTLCEILRAEPRDADAWHELGTSLLLLGDRTGACGAWRQALQLDRGRAITRRALGNLLFDCGQIEPALHCFERLQDGAGGR